MKKIAILLVVVLALCTTAFAKDILPDREIDLASADFGTGSYSAEFSVSDITDSTILVAIYEEDHYDIVDIDQMQVGDTITNGYGTVTVKELDRSDNGIYINGGDYEGGVTLYSYEDSNGWISFDFELPTYTRCGHSVFPMAENVSISVFAQYYAWYEDNTDDIVEGYRVTTVPAAQVRSEFEKLEENLGDHFVPAETTVIMEDGVITGIVIDYIP